MLLLLLIFAFVNTTTCCWLLLSGLNENIFVSSCDDDCSDLIQIRADNFPLLLLAHLWARFCFLLDDSAFAVATSWSLWYFLPYFSQRILLIWFVKAANFFSSLSLFKSVEDRFAIDGQNLAIVSLTFAAHTQHRLTAAHKLTFETVWDACAWNTNLWLTELVGEHKSLVGSVDFCGQSSAVCWPVSTAHAHSVRSTVGAI